MEGGRLGLVRKGGLQRKHRVPGRDSPREYQTDTWWTPECAEKQRTQPTDSVPQRESMCLLRHQGTGKERNTCHVSDHKIPLDKELKAEEKGQPPCRKMGQRFEQKVDGKEWE